MVVEPEVEGAKGWKRGSVVLVEMVEVPEDFESRFWSPARLDSVSSARF